MIETDSGYQAMVATKRKSGETEGEVNTHTSHGGHRGGMNQPSHAFVDSNKQGAQGA